MASITEAKAILSAVIKQNLKLAANDNSRDAQTVVLNLVGHPGIGKTVAVYDTGRDLGMHVEVVRLSEYLPSDAAGWNV